MLLMSSWDRKKHNSEHDLPNAKVHGKHAVQDSLLRKTRKKLEVFPKYMANNGMMCIIKSSVHQK